jgi:hypothetical protein
VQGPPAVDTVVSSVAVHRAVTVAESLSGLGVCESVIVMGTICFSTLTL